MSNSDTPCQATPAKDIRDRLMNPCFAKTEAEHYAVREIERLERELAAAKKEYPTPNGLASFPKVDYKKSDFHFTINYTVWMGGSSICYCDREDRAELVARAFNHWIKTPDAKKWWKSIRAIRGEEEVRIELHRRPDLDKWPSNSNRILIPTIILAGFMGHKMLITIGFWKWRMDLEIIP